MAVYTEVPDDALRDFVSAYDIGDVTSCKGIAEGVENSNYLLRTTEDDYILTLYEKRVRREDLPFFLGLMDHLSGKNFPAPVPIHGKDGVALRELCGKPAAICSFLDGMWPRTITADHCRQLGEAAARLHLAAADMRLTRLNALGPAGWAQLAAATESRADEVQTGLAGLIREELAFLNAACPDNLPTGVIHADMFPDNVFFNDDRLSGVIDFYFACNDALAYEIAVCLNAWCFDESAAYRKECGKALIDGYNSIRPLSTVETDALPILCRGAALRFLLTRLYDVLNHPPGAFVKPKDPMDYVARLSFHQGVISPDQYSRSAV